MKDSPAGPGHITGITPAGFPIVNRVVVERLTRTDGAVFDPYESYIKDALKYKDSLVVKSESEKEKALDSISEEDFLNIIQSSQELSGRIALTFESDTGTKLTSVAKTLLKACNRHLAYKS